MIGYAKLKNIEELKIFVKKNGADNDSSSRVYRGGWYWSQWKQFNDISEKSYTVNVFDSPWDSRKINDFEKMVEHLEEENQPLVCYAENEIAVVVGCNAGKYLLPKEYFDIEPLKSYDGLSVAELKRLGRTSADILPVVIDDISKESLNEQRRALEDKAQDYKQQADDIKAGKSAELAEVKAQIEQLQAELQAKQDVLMATLNEKKLELEEQTKKLNDQIFVLDSQIYSIRCYLGEVISFTPVTSGQNANKDEPVVIYQKIRYIDEEFGKYLGMYDVPVTSENGNTLIKVLQNRPDIRELFAPNDKCVSVLKMSRTGRVKGASEDVNNILKDYKIYHGTQIAILVRNGENLYIGWTDDEKVSISDENVFYAPKVDAYQGTDDTESVIEQASSRNDRVSRLFIMSILQGLQDNDALLSLPEGTNILKSSPYVIFSAAEGWLDDSTYGTYESILAMSKHIPLKEGDHVLTAMSIGRDDGYSERYESYNNDRGIGIANRTHDAHIPGMQILPINKVLHDAVLEYTYEMYEAEISSEPAKVIKYSEDKVEKLYSWNKTENKIGFKTSTDTIDFESWRENHDLTVYVDRENRRIKENIYWDTVAEEQWYTSHRSDSDKIDTDGKTNFHTLKCVKAEVKELKPHYFLSTTSSSWMSGNDYHVNMEIYMDECHPLAYLCPTWIEYVIKTGNIGNIRLCGANMTYADLLHDLNAILAHLREVNKEEKAHLTAAGLTEWMKNTSDWDVKVTEWRIQHKVRKLTAASAKRFAKTIN